MKKLILTIIVLLLFCSFLQNNKINDVRLNNNSTDDVVSVVFAGDVMGHSPQFKAAYDAITDTYNYDICFKNLKDYISSADLAIANLEVTLSGKPYSGYPEFSSPDELVDGLKNAGFDVLLTANNHIYDKGRVGLERTINVLNKKGIYFLGSYKDTAQKDSLYPLILNIKDLRICLLNYTYATNNNAIEQPNIVNLIDSMLIFNDIEKAKKLSDLIFFTAHWGNEYQLFAGTGQMKMARDLNRAGVDLIIGSHPHVIENAELLENEFKTTPVFYSLGNFISNQRKLDTNGGLIVKIVINTKYKRITDVTYLPVYVYRGILNQQYQYHLIPTPDFISHPSKYKIPFTDSVALVEFDKRTRERISGFKIETYYSLKK